MNPVLRLAGAALVAVLAVGVVFVALRPATSVGPPGTSPSPAASPTLPALRPLAPSAVIDLAGTVKNTIPLTTDGTDVWIGVDGAIVHVDGRTNATQRLVVPAMSTGNGEIAITADSLWIADFKGGRIQRLDPSTGAVKVTGSVLKPNFLYVVGGELWLGLGAADGLVKVDQATGAVGPHLVEASQVAFGLGDAWSGIWDGVSGEHLGSSVITRTNATTGAATATIRVPPGSGCTVSGSFPDNVWASCPVDFGTCPANRIAVRIDPSTNEVVTTAQVCGNPVVVIDGTPWFLAGRMDGQNEAYALVSVDPGTGRLLARFDLGKIGPNQVVLTDTALWISDEQNDRVVRYDLTQLR